MTVTADRLKVRDAARELGIDAADLLRMIFAGDVAARPSDRDATVYITADELERLRTRLPR